MARQGKDNIIRESELDIIFDNVICILNEELKPFEFYPTNIELLGRNAGVKGDIGLRGWTIVFNANKLYDKLPVYLQWDILKKIEQRITGEIKEITRVLYEIQK